MRLKNRTPGAFYEGFGRGLTAEPFPDRRVITVLSLVLSLIKFDIGFPHFFLADVIQCCH